MVEVARPWTKWAVEVDRLEELPSALRRAAQLALTPPTGPVFLALPIDLQMEQAELDLSPPAPLDTRVRPPQDAVRRVVDALLSAQNPGILVGSRVVEADAVAELVSVAERLGAPVISEAGHTHGRLSFPADHPLYGQILPHWSPEIRERLAEFDLLLVVGMDLLREYVYHEPARAVPEHCRLVHLDESPYQIGKNYPVEVGVLGDVKSSLAEIDAALSRRMNHEACRRATTRGATHAQRHRSTRETLQRRVLTEKDARPMTPLTLMNTLASVLPDDVAVIEEAVTTTNSTFQRLGALRNTSGYFGHRGWALGWGLGCALGVKLAWPQRPVLAVLGEGAAMYGIQGLWSAARYRIPVTFVIPNNAQYQILKAGARGFGLPAALAEKFVGMDLREPEVDIVGIARSLGVEALRVREPDDLAGLVAESLQADRPRLFDVPIQRSLAGPG
jgi:benzoylformate decarboxylase